jgi:hypothetical protein
VVPIDLLVVVVPIAEEGQQRADESFGRREM